MQDSTSKRGFTPKNSISARIGGVVRAARLVGIRCDGRTLARCPACGAEARTAVAGRLPRHGASRVSVSPSQRGWCCHACSASGGAAALLAYAWYRCPPERLTREQWAQLCDRVDAELGHLPPMPAYVPPPSAIEIPRRRDSGAILYRGQRISMTALRAAWCLQSAERSEIDEFRHGAAESAAVAPTLAGTVGSPRDDGDPSRIEDI